MASAWLEQQGLKPTKGPAIKGETIAEVKGTDYGDGVLPNKLNRRQIQQALGRIVEVKFQADEAG
jgi:hypothetical protein